MKSCIFLTLSLASLILETAKAGTFISIGSGNWEAPGTWSASGDADGIPDSDDDVTVSAGHTISVILTSNACNNLTNSGTMTGPAVTRTILVYGDYINNGSETSTYTLQFRKINGTITGSGVFGAGVRYNFFNNTSLMATSTIVKSSQCRIRWGTTVTNLCTFRLNAAGSLVGDSPTTSVWLNGATGTLILFSGTNFLASGGIRDFSTPGNTLETRYTGTLITVSGGSVYRNLRVTTGTLSLGASTLITEVLTLNGTGNLNQNGFDLTVRGNISQSSSGVISQSGTENLILGGVSGQLFSTTNLILRNLMLNNAAGATVTSGNLSVASTLTLTNGDLSIGGAATFTLLSTATETARIEEVTGSSQIIGNMTCQRFITGEGAGRDTTWADLAAPVTATTFADWDAELLMYYSSGQDAMAYGFDEVADDFYPVTSSGQSILPGQGFEVFLADDFTLQNWSGATLTSVGTPNVGDQDLSSMVSFTSGNSNYNLVGNPFQSCINWADVFAASSNIDNSFEYYDYTAGTYSVGGGSDEIPTGQGFWVLTTGSNPQLLVLESAKTTSANSTLRNNTTAFPYMSLTIASADNSHTYSHKMRVGTDFNSTRSYDTNDHPFRPSPNRKAPAIYSTTADGKKVVIYAFEDGLAEIVIPFTVKVGISGDYKISASDLGYVSNYSCITLVDHETGKNYDLNTQNEVVVEGLEAGITYQGRFELRLSGADCAPTHITGLFENSFDVITNGNQTLVNFRFNELTPVSIQVTNAMGQQIINTVAFEAGVNSCTLNLPADFNGLYMVTVMNGSDLMTKKLIKY
jgi:hypothetical protein